MFQVKVSNMTQQQKKDAAVKIKTDRKRERQCLIKQRVKKGHTEKKLNLFASHLMFMGAQIGPSF